MKTTDPYSDQRHEGSSHSAEAARFRERRRAFIKGSAATLPVAATVMSQPALATNTCTTTSAWGSRQIGATSQTASPITVTSYSIADWNNNTNTIWSTLFAAHNFGYADASSLRNRLKVTELLGSAPSGMPSGMDGNSKVKNVLAVTIPTSYFANYIIVARLNLWISTSVGSCITDAIIIDMKDASYQPSNGSVPWDQNTIKNYLSNNWIAW